MKINSLFIIHALRVLEEKLIKILYALNESWSEEREHFAWESNAHRRDAARRYLEEAMTAVRIVSSAIKKVIQPDEALMKELCALADEVMGRFSLVEGICPLRLGDLPGEASTTYTIRRGYTILTQDGRDLSHLSTGQKVQTAIAMLAAQNQAVSHLLPHRILLLDDVTTAYDLSNLTREAILWRQLAYGTTGMKKRQVFISSHHEDLTNHLLDLLVPPNGHTMRLIRFTGWSPQQGPSFEQFTVVPTQSSNAARLAFTEDLETTTWRPN